MNAATRITIAISLAAACAALASPSARAQAEVAPDHFDAPDMVPFTEAQASTAAAPAAQAANLHYDGKVTLAHSVHCNGKSLAPGKYAVSLRSDGRTVQVSLKQGGRVVTLQGAAHANVRICDRGYLVVERRGNERRLQVIHAGAVQLVFAPEAGRTLSANAPATLEVLPLAFIATES
jgi:hypothetical protein